MPTFVPKSMNITFTVEVHDADPVSLGSWSTTLFRPVTAAITFNDGKFARLVAAGPNVKKDGSDGQNRHDRSWGDWGFNSDETPDWVRTLVDGIRPAAQAAADRGPF